ncbi:MAG: sodium:proton symporter [Kiritimatiellia bacterium]
MGKILIDAIVFFGFIACVLFVGLFKSRKKAGDGENGAEDYFLAGRGLSWWLIGFSLIAANISAEQFVGMSGQGAGLEGISCASWEWIAAITLVIVAFALLPYFLKMGLTTIPEFLEVRFNHWARTLMTVSMMGILVVASLIGVTYAGSLVMYQLFGEFGVAVSFPACCWIMGVIAGVYVLFGGLKACAWADLLQGSALIVGGAVIAYFAMRYLGETPVDQLAGFGGATTSTDAGVVQRLVDLNAAKLHMGRPATDAAMPWTILIMGIWIPNFYYWGLNQYIIQRVLGSSSLGEGQKGLVLASGLKLLIPFIIVIPGIIAFNLCSKEMAKDTATVIAEKLDAGVYGANELVTLYSLKADAKTAKQSEIALAAQLTPEHLAKLDAHNRPILDKLIADKKLTALDSEVIKGLAAVGKAGMIDLEDGQQVTIIGNTYKYDGALGHLMKLIPRNKGILGFVLAALLGAIVSSLAAVLNATSTLFTMDIFQRYIDPKAKQGTLVFTGRVVIVVLVIVGCLAASALRSESIFSYIQEVQCYVSPGVLAVFAFGMINRRAGRWAGVMGLLVAPVLYYFLSNYGWNCFPERALEIMSTIPGLGVPATAATGSMHYLIAASYTLVLTLLIMTIYGCFVRMPQPVVFEHKTKLDMTMSKAALIFGLIVCVLTVVLYLIFW